MEGTMRTKMTGTLLLSLSLATGGCGMDDQSFLEDLYAEQCAYEFACQPGISEQAYGDEEGCKEVYAPYIEDGVAYFEGCRLESKAARDCLKTLQELDCVAEAGEFDPLFDACDVYEIWTCESE